ncbi:MAG: methyltransferase [Acidobacteriota bacterium]
MNALTRMATWVGHGVWRPWLRRRLGRVVVETVEDLPLVVLPEVFNPAVFRSGSFLAHTLRHAHELAPTDPAARALDLGTGSGVGAVFAARRGFETVAVDLNPHAVRCCRINALLHEVEERIEVREGDLFAPVAKERFDLVLFNPPFFVAPPKSALDAAWRSRDVLPRFADGLATHLTPDGLALLVLSTDGEGEALLADLRTRGFGVSEVARRAFGNEILTASAVRPSASERS